MNNKRNSPLFLIV